MHADVALRALPGMPCCGGPFIRLAGGRLVPAPDLGFKHSKACLRHAEPHLRTALAVSMRTQNVTQTLPMLMRTRGNTFERGGTCF